MTGTETKTEADATAPARSKVPENFSALNPKAGLQFIASSPDCVKLLDLEGNLRFINQNGLCLLELDDFTSVEGRRWSCFWPDAVSSEIETAMGDATSGRVGRFSGYCPTAKGTPKWWDVAISPVYDDDGKLIWLLVVSRDISSQKLVEQALRVSEERFRALTDNIAQLAWMADPSGSAFWYNQRWYDFTGTTPEDMKGWGWKSVHHPEHLDRVVEKITNCFQNGLEWEDTFPLRAADGSYRWFLSRAMPIRDDSGHVTLWCGTNTDITEQRNASQRLRQLARLIELSHEAIMVRSPSGSIMLWNRGCEDLYGYTSTEALGMDSHDLLKTDTALSSGEIEALLQSEGTWSGELVRMAKDGTRVWVDSRKQVIKLGSDVVILETDRDITERHKADEVRNLLVGELNHRVKNTLAIVQSLASQTARTTRSIGDFVSGFTGRLQSLSSAHNVLTDTNWSGAELRELVKTQIDVIAGDGRKIELDGPDVFVPAQAALQLTLILHELTTNALKHGALSQAGGRISISWSVTREPVPALHLTWQELGGPRVAKPVSRGFGLSLIERSGRLPHLMTDLSFNESGIACHITAKLDEALPAGAEPYFNPKRNLAQTR